MSDPLTGDITVHVEPCEHASFPEAVVYFSYGDDGPRWVADLATPIHDALAAPNQPGERR